jgi:DtxR family transcriptional regulator, Mn-dependent transcriptional regulator
VPDSVTTRQVPDALVTELFEVLLERAGTTTHLADVLAVRPLAAEQVERGFARLSDEGALEADSAGVRLTALGVTRATEVVRRHRLTERLLADVLGLEWWKVHHEADRFEHALSEETEARLVTLLGDPGTCPHGNPIPGSANQPTHPDEVLLCDAPIGPVHVVRVTGALEADDEALQLLQGCGFLPGRDAEVKARSGGWIEVAGTVHDAALPPHVTSHTYVAPR